MKDGDSVNNIRNCPHCERTKERGEAEKKALLNRLSRIEGQIRGIRGMVEKDAYCPDVLIQTSAVSAALSSFARTLLSEHIRTCVTQDVRAGKDDSVDELLSVLQRFMK